MVTLRDSYFPISAMLNLGRTKKGTSALMAYPGFGYRTDDSNWRVHVAGVAWQEPVVFTRRQQWLIRMLGGAMKAMPEELESSIFKNRITPFMAEADTRQSVQVEINGHTLELRRKTRRNGHYRDFFTVPDHAVSEAATTDGYGNRVVEYHVRLGESRKTVSTSQVYLMENRGLSVISDIDDTIKDSGVGDRTQLLANTFLRDFRTIEGMADVYRQWSSCGANFHYVSSSPWQLFEPLQALNVDGQFPVGTIHLRNFRLRDQLFKKVMIRRRGKSNAIRLLMRSLPGRDFILVGDSGERDPEIYRKICRKHPGRVKGLFIRNVSHRPMDADRRQKLAELSSQTTFATFDDADELASLSGDLIAELQQSNS